MCMENNQCFIRVIQQLIYMNIEKIVASYFDKKRSQSLHEKKQNNYCNSINKCYEPEMHSFHPTVSQIPRSIYKITTKTQCSREEIIQRLYNDRRSIEGKRAIQKLTEQQKQYKQNCTFQPQTNPKSKRILKTQCTEQDPFERLYHEGITKKKLSQSLSYLQQNKQNCTFQPQTNYKNILNTQKCNMKPIHERIEEIVKNKRERIKVLQDQHISQQMTAKPTINQVSQRIISNKGQFKKGILSRISGYIQQKKRKQEITAEHHNQNLMKQCTFKPEINSTIQVSTNFLARQEQYLRRMEQKMTSRIIRQNNFQPQINKISEILMRDEREGETFDDKINRIANDDFKRDKIDEIEREIYQECTFVPQINAISKCLAAEHVSHKCNHTPDEQVYQFKPKINKLSQQIAKLAKFRKAQSLDQKQYNKQYLSQLKMQIQYKQLKQCTFKPKINYSRPKPTTNLNNIKGYESFVKKIEKINQLKDEQKELKQKLFNKQKNYKNRKSTTPLQFKLSQGYNLKQGVKQEVREKFEKQCTFKPQIISYR